MRLTLLCCSLLLCLPAAASEVFRWVDENGVVHYSDRPFGEEAERLSVRTARPAPATPAAPAAPAAPPEGDTGGKLFSDPDPQAQAELREANCQVARGRLSQIERSPRLFREAPDGGRRYLTDEEIADVRREAEELVDAWCD